MSNCILIRSEERIFSDLKNNSTMNSHLEIEHETDELMKKTQKGNFLYIVWVKIRDLTNTR